MPTARIASTKQNINNLLEAIDLTLKVVGVRSKFKDAYHMDTKSVTKKNVNLSKTSVNFANECLQSHRFGEAAKLLWLYCQDRSTCDTLLYKGIMVVLENLQLNNANETVLKFCSDIQGHVSLNKLDVQLEYILYALRTDGVDIQDSFKKVTTGRFMKKIKKIPYIEQVLTAYCALFHYIAWRNCCGDQMSHQVKEIADMAVSDLLKVIENPGTWDIFVLKIIEVLEHYENYEQITEVLKKYVELNPGHVNAYIYLCVHLHKHNPDSKEFILYSKVLSQLCPSDIRVLFLVHTWDKLGQKLKERLKILFMFLDYPVNGKNIVAWQMLASHLSQAIKSKKSSTKAVVKSSWSIRHHVWEYLHFHPRKISSEVEDNPKLVKYKVEVLSVLQPDNKYRKKTLKKFPHLLRPDSTNLEETAEICESFLQNGC